MRRTSPLIIAASLLVAVATTFVIFAGAPEEVRVSSPDGMVDVSGLARDALPFLIEPGAKAGGSVLLGSVYSIEPSQIRLESPVAIKLSLTGLNVESSALAIYRFDDDLNLWGTVLPVTEQTSDFLEVETDRLGKFSLGYAKVLQAPNFLTTFEQLLAMAPDGTVGYKITTGYQLSADEPIIALSGSTEVGGCGGVVSQGNRQEKSERRQTTRVLVDDVQTDVMFYFLAEWFVSDLTSCPQDSPLLAYPLVVQ